MAPGAGITERMEILADCDCVLMQSDAPLDGRFEAIKAVLDDSHALALTQQGRDYAAAPEPVVRVGIRVEGTLFGE